MKDDGFKQLTLTPFVDQVKSYVEGLKQAPQQDILSHIDNNFQGQTEVQGILKKHLPGLVANVSLLDKPINEILGSGQLLGELTSLYQTSTADFRSLIIKMVQQGKHLNCLDKLFEQDALNNSSNHAMLHEFYNICSDDMGKHSFERKFFAKLKPLKNNDSFIKFLTYSPPEGSDQKNLFKAHVLVGLKTQFAIKKQSMMKGLVGKSSQKTIFDTFGKSLNQKDLKDFVKRLSKEDDDDYMKTLHELIFENTQVGSRDSSSQMIQLIIHNLFESNASSYDVISKLAEKCKSDEQKNMLYAEVAHYFKIPSGSPISRRFNRSNSTSYYGRFVQNGLSTSTHSHDHKLVRLIQNAKSKNNSTLLAHLCVAIPKFGSNYDAFSEMSDYLSDLQFHADISKNKDTFIRTCEELVTPNDLKELQTLFYLNSIIDGIKIARGQQMTYRQKITKANKVQKISSVNSAYALIEFFRQYEKYSRNFEVEKTKSMSVSHVSGSLSIGT